MAINGNPAPDNNAAAFALQQDIMQRANGGKPSYIGPFPLEWHASGSLGLSGVSFLGKPICQLNNSFKNRNADRSALAAALGGMHDQFKKMASEANIIHSGELPSGTPISSNSSFVANIGSSTPSSGFTPD